MHTKKDELHQYMTKDMYHARLKIILLSKISKKETYSYQLLKDISKHKSKFFPEKDLKNDVYNTISSLQSAGYIRMNVRTEGGKKKKYYKITKKGAATLKETKAVFHNAVKEILKILS